MAALKLLKATVGAGEGSTVYYFKGSATAYADADVAAATGISVAPDADREKIPHRVPDLLLGGALIRLAVTTGTTAASRETKSVLCTIDKLPSVRESSTSTPKGLVGASLNSKVISSVRVKRDIVAVS